MTEPDFQLLYARESRLLTAAICGEDYDVLRWLRNRVHRASAPYMKLAG